MSRWEKKERALHIRLPGRLRDALDAEAKRTERSIAYILMQMLQRRYPDDSQP